MDFNVALNPAPKTATEVADAASPPAHINPVEVVKAALSIYDAPLEKMVSDAAALEVKDQASQVTAVEMAGQVKKLDKAIEKARKAYVDPANEYVKSVNNLAKAYQNKFRDIEAALKGKIGSYQSRIEFERRKAEDAARKAAAEAQAKLDAEAKAANVEPVQIVVPVVPDTPKTVRTAEGSASQRKVWVFTVVEPQDVPREYLAVDEKAIRQAVAAGVRTIPGVDIFEKTDITIRS